MEHMRYRPDPKTCQEIAALSVNIRQCLSPGAVVPGDEKRLTGMDAKMRMEAFGYASRSTNGEAAMRGTSYQQFRRV